MKKFLEKLGRKAAMEATEPMAFWEVQIPRPDKEHLAPNELSGLIRGLKASVECWQGQQRIVWEPDQLADATRLRTHFATSYQKIVDGDSDAIFRGRSPSDILITLLTAPTFLHLHDIGAFSEFQQESLVKEVKLLEEKYRNLTRAQCIEHMKSFALKSIRDWKIVEYSLAQITEEHKHLRISS